MSEQKKLLLKIFKAELEDCIEDAEDLSNLYERRFCSDDVTNYVYQENRALLQREIAGLRDSLQILDSLNIEQYKDYRELAGAIDEIIQKVVMELEDPEAVYTIAKRKLLKVLKYIEDRSI
ncbi:hypothetical protein [Treponema sp. J25]|uniref:hypothetical protein n=1 Tax=Treponema sp. J25 TaxID=2094121 RepID=UPI001044CB8F|nr:hypothetical protein [Treponema sp. J25]TCW60282.1 hypothetical protein C5O22_12135 [Treponema sp. J25]